MKRLLVLTLVVSLFGMAAAAQTLTIYADDTRTPLFRDIIGPAYTAATGIAVEVTEFANDVIRENFITATQAGTGPDIVIGANDWVGQLVADGLVEALDLGGRAGDFAGAALKAFSVGDSLYAMPYAGENIALYYDKDLIPVAPRTWDELMAIARSLYDPDAPFYGLVMENTSGNFYQFFPFISGGGGYIFGFNEDGTYNPCDVGVNAPGVAYSVGLYKTMIDEGLLPVGTNGDTEQALIEGKNAALFITGPWRITNFENSGMNYGITRIPAMPTASGAYIQPQAFAGYNGFFVSSMSANKTIALDFLLNYVATVDVMVQLETIGNRATVFLPAAEQSNPDLLAFAEQGAFTVPMPSIPEMASVWGAGGDLVDLINSGEDPATVLANAEAAILLAVPDCE